MWKSGRTAISRSSGCSHIRSTNASPVSTTLRWLCIAPLGNPVVPEV